MLSLVHADNMDEALAFLERSAYGNQASLFTSSGSAARRFRYEAPAGNIGINIGVAAPMAYFPFSGWKNSFFGDLHGQGRDAIEFYTDKKVVVERWAKEHSQKVLSSYHGDTEARRNLCVSVVIIGLIMRNP